MSEINNGGPAFPSHGVMGEVTHEGMTMRDYFAAKAMEAMLTHSVNGDWPEHKNVAKHAYDMADEMLHARGAA